MIWKGQTSFSIEFRKIARISMGIRSIVFASLKKAYPSMTHECMGCHADTLTCGITHCKTQCGQSQVSLDCRQCVDKHCIKPYKLCIGVQDDADLPIPPWSLPQNL